MNTLNPNISNNINNNFQPTAGMGYGVNYNNPNIPQQVMNNSLPAGGFNMNQMGLGILNRVNPEMFNYQTMPGFNNNNSNNQMQQQYADMGFYPRRGTVNLSAMGTGMEMNAFNNNLPNQNVNFNNVNILNQSYGSGGGAAQIPPMFYNTMRNDPNLINRFFEMQNNMQNLNTQNEEETRLRQEEELQRMIDDEAEMQNLKDEMKLYLKTAKNIAYIKQDLFGICRSEYLNERDRYFFEELIQQPLKTSGFLGLGNVMLDKNALFADKSKGNLSLGYSKNTNYFDKICKDGVYLDYVKQKVYSYNIQKIEQRLLREVYIFFLYIFFFYKAFMNNREILNFIFYNKCIKVSFLLFKS